MDVSEELQRAVARNGECDQRIMAERETPLVDADFVEMRGAAPAELSDPAAIVVADNQVLATRNGREDVGDIVSASVMGLGKGEISDDPEIIRSPDPRLILSQDVGIHLLHIGEATVTEVDDIVIPRNVDPR